MPIIKKEQEREYIELIRRVLVYHPDAGVLTVQKLLEKPTLTRPQGLHLDWVYLSRLVEKIRKERIKRINRGTIKRVSELQDHFNALISEVRTIVSNPQIDSKDKAELLIKLFGKNLELFQAEQDAGIFERNLGTFRIEAKLTEERKILIIQAFRNFGIIKGEISPAPTEKNNEPASNK